MAGLRATVSTTGDIGCDAADLTTILSLTAPANQRLLVRSIELFFAGVLPTDIPCLVTWNRFSSAGTPGGTVTPVALDVSQNETLQATSGEDFDGAEPGVTSILYNWLIHPQGGILTPFSLARRIDIIGGEHQGISVTAPATVNCRCTIVYEE